MDDHSRHRIAIPPVPSTPDAAPRPLWSVMIPTYHCAEYLRETLAGVLAQDPGPERMQIEVVDDHSTRDDPERVIAEVGGGRVELFRQPANVGHTRNFDTCLLRARGRLVHLLHGDDGVRDGFYRAMERAFAERPEVGAAFCRQIIVDEHGDWQTISPLEQRQRGPVPGWLERIATGQRLQTPAMVVRREVYERLGGFDHRIRAYGEDWEMWVRIAAHYPVWYEPEPLALYRIHSRSLSAGVLGNGANNRDLERALAINRAVLPPDRADALVRQARVNHALAALRRAQRMLKAGALAAPFAQMREAVRWSRSAEVLAHLALTSAMWGAAAVGRLAGRRGRDVR